jgi:hypothetical protein
VVRGGSQAISQEKRCKNCISHFTISHFMSVLKLPVLVDLEQKVRESLGNLFSFNHYFRKHLNYSIEKNVTYGNSDHRYNVSPVHLHELGVRNFTKVVRVCADGLL